MANLGVKILGISKLQILVDLSKEDFDRPTFPASLEKAMKCLWIDAVSNLFDMEIGRSIISLLPHLK